MALNIFITGANRGIGLEMTEQMLHRLKPEHIFATYRDPSTSQVCKNLVFRMYVLCIRTNLFKKLILFQDLLELASKHENLHPLQLGSKGKNMR